ncbi:AbfB domain-containing protein [Deinococcus sp.]|uniref:AbfB domain-containing protein n=1 Tax=Deinococcus sp. TaxID=47478 RepID=UPI0025D7CAC5|nr:AbfB domain-containing protein [Deinococcus sp.]
MIQPVAIQPRATRPNTTRLPARAWRLSVLGLSAALNLVACSPGSGDSGAPAAGVQPQALSTAPLPLNTYRSLQVTTPGLTNRSLRQTAGLAFTEIVGGASAQGLRQDATFRIVRGLGDAGCYSFESQNLRGQYLRHQGSRVKLSASDGSAVYAADATWCSRPGLSGSGVSLESLNFPGRYLRHINSEVWLAQSGGPLPSDNAASFNQDVSWNLVTAWNRSGVALPLALQSWQVTNAGLTDRYLRHQASLGYTSPVSAASDATTRADATWRIVPGLADAGCYSFEASNFAGSYLRHSNFRLRIDPNDNGAQFRADATFCTQPGLSGAGVSLESYNLSGQFIRHVGGELWLASGAGARPSDGAASFVPDVSWGLAVPWSTGVVSSPTPPSPTPPPPSPTPPPVPGKLTFTVQNETGGAYPDAQVYWAIYGYNPTTKQLSHVDAGGNLVAAAPGDNDAPGHVSKNGINYANYATPLSAARSLLLPKMYGARIFLSVGSPMFIKVLGIPGGVGFAGPDVNNPADPNTDVIFDFVEFTYNDIGFFGNNTRVDQFGFPVRTRLVGANYDSTLGDNVSRAQIFSDFRNIAATEFRSLVQPNRILAPVKGSFGAGRPNGNYMDSYINQVWDYYRSRDLVFTAEAGTFRGRVTGNDFIFSRDGGPSGLYIRGKPTTQNVLEASGPVASGSSDELVVQAQIAAALNRHLLIDVDPSQWANQSAFYPAAPANFYAKFWHDHSINNLAYGFAYDDVRAFSSSQFSTTPSQFVVSVGW